MKKVLFVLLLCGSLFLMSGCGNEKIEGSLEDLMTKVYEGIPEDQRPMGLANMEVNDDNIEGFLGTGEIEYREALASESMVGSIAHSVVLLRTEDGADVEDVKTKIKENVNPRKWICVGVEEEDVIIKNKGDLIIVIIVEDEATREKIDEGFENL